MLQVALTLESVNKKTGPIPVSTTTALTCPDMGYLVSGMLTGDIVREAFIATLRREWCNT